MLAHIRKLAAPPVFEDDEDKTRTAKVGLSITFGIVEKLGGRIAVQSKVGEGAGFTVRLPVTRQS